MGPWIKQQPPPQSRLLGGSRLSQVRPKNGDCRFDLVSVFMIIKGLFRRYRRWNPVHPTIGTFWGMGIGIGCGVGWGPGFGPEVIGYVGAGCGVGFSVGITIAGIGVGLPQNGLIQILHIAGIGVGLPQNGLIQILHNAFTMNTALESARSFTLATAKGVAEHSLSFAVPHISFLGKETCGRLSRLKSNIYVQRDGLNKLKTAVSKQIQSTLECLEALRDNSWPPRKDS